MAALNGIEAVVAQAQAEAGDVLEAATQLPLLPAAPAMPAAGGGGDGGRRGGRPKGARNKSTEDFRQYVLARYRSPLIAMAETFSRSVADLARELDCDRLEAFKLQLRAMESLAPYLHQRLPQAVQIENKGLPLLAIGAFAQAGGEAAGGLFGMIAEAQQNQSLSISPEAELNDRSLTDDENSSDIKGFGDATD